MKIYIYLFVILTMVFSSHKPKDKFYLHKNGVTCRCPNTTPGEKGFINGIEFESVDNDLLRQRIDEEVDITKLCTSLVTDMSKIFMGLGYRTFNQPIGHWDVSNVTNMSSMFSDTQFNQSIGDWDVSKVTDMSSMFRSTEFNQPIGDWDVSNVKYMEEMFRNSQFNQNISKWCVTKITREPEGFSNNSPLTPENKPKWGTCPNN